jgi:hypothetical protein
LEIIEFELDLEVRPICRLKEENDIDALLLGDWRTIVVDQVQYMDRRFANRLRYSMAHELGHYVLHEAVFQQIPRGSIQEWMEFMRDIPEKEYSFIEYHANEFAGRFLARFAGSLTQLFFSPSRTECQGTSFKVTPTWSILPSPFHGDLKCPAV